MAMQDEEPARLDHNVLLERRRQLSLVKRDPEQAGRRLTLKQCRRLSQQQSGNTTPKGQQHSLLASAQPVGFGSAHSRASDASGFVPPYAQQPGDVKALWDFTHTRLAQIEFLIRQSKVNIDVDQSRGSVHGSVGSVPRGARSSVESRHSADVATSGFGMERAASDPSPAPSPRAMRRVSTTEWPATPSASAGTRR